MKELYITIVENLTREGIPDTFIMRQMEVAESIGLRYADYFDFIYDEWDLLREFKEVH